MVKSMMLARVWNTRQDRPVAIPSRLLPMTAAGKMQFSSTLSLRKMICSGESSGGPLHPRIHFGAFA